MQQWLIVIVIVCDLVNLGCTTYPPLTAKGAATIDGYATTYSPDPSPRSMEQVSRNRELPIVKCMVASPFHEIGDWIRVKSKNTGVMLRCRVTDVSAPEDEARHRKNKLFEFDFTSWKKLCGTTFVGEQPWRQCEIEARDE